MEFINQLNPEETILIGKWKKIGYNIVRDENCRRIEKLKSDYLKKISVDKSGWETLYQDPNDNRYWLLTYPDSECHGGGPPTLKMITPIEAFQIFGID